MLENDFVDFVRSGLQGGWVGGMGEEEGCEFAEGVEGFDGRVRGEGVRFEVLEGVCWAEEGGVRPGGRGFGMGWRGNALREVVVLSWRSFIETEAAADEFALRGVSSKFHLFKREKRHTRR